MKIVLIGLGSIGTRHLRNILSLGYHDVSVVSRKSVLPVEFSALKVYADIEQAITASKFDAAVICTPTSLHTAALQQLVEAGIQKIYLEKPVSHSLDGLDILLELVASYNNNIVVGFDLHFDPGIQKVKELLGSDEIGKVVSVNAQVGQYLPDWRPHEDYRHGMSARTETGGGVLLDLIHEFDYLYWLLGDVQLVAAFINNSGALEIETEDVAEVLLQFKNGCIGTIHLDYLQHQLIRNCVITGFNGTIVWDLVKSKVSWINEQKLEQHFSYAGFNRNERFVSIMKAFLNGERDERLTSLEDGIKSLQMVMAAKQSAATGKFITISSLTTVTA